MENNLDKILTGKTFHIKEDLKNKFNARWNGNYWTVKSNIREEAQKFVDESQNTQKNLYNCRKCGDVCDILDRGFCDKCDWGF